MEEREEVSRKKLLGMLSVLSLIALGLWAGGKKEAPASAPKFTLRISTVISTSDPMYKGYALLAENLGKRTNGAIQATVYPDAQLGQDEDVMEQALLGADVAFNTDAGRLGVRVKQMGIVLAPYLFENPAEAKKFLLSDLFKGWQKELKEKHNLVLLALNYYAGGRNFVTKKPVLTPEDLKGMRIRTPGAPVWQESIRSMGATPVALPWVETYPALQQGVIDGAEAQHPATFGAKLYEVAKNISLTNHILLMNGPVVGAKWFNQLPKEFQDILFEEAIKAGDFVTQTVLDLEKDYEKKMAAGGATIHTVDVKPFKEKAQNAYVALGLVELKKEVEKVLGK